MITALQIRLAKAALGLSNTDLSEITKLHKNTINNAENGKGGKKTLKALKFIFEQRGVKFIENGIIYNDFVEPFYR